MKFFQSFQNRYREKEIGENTAIRKRFALNGNAKTKSGNMAGQGGGFIFSELFM